MKEQFAFLRDVADAQDRGLAESPLVAHEIERLQEAQLTASVPRLAAARGSSRRLIASVAVAASIAAGTAAYFGVQGRPLTFAIADEKRGGELGASLTAPEGAPVALDFSDGSHLKLAAGGLARVTRLDAHGAVVKLERGHADVAVVPRRGANWRIEAGPFHVFVKGTEFSLDWDPATERLDFRLLKGAVVIDGGCLERAHALTAGESLYTSCRPNQAVEAPASAMPAAPSAPPLAIPGNEPPVGSASEVGKPGAVGAVSKDVDRPSWRQLAAKQDYPAALAAAERTGFDSELKHASAEDLLSLGDVARLAGNPSRALQAYLAARARGPAGNRSAFAIGLVQFDQRHAYGEAERWFSVYLREHPGGPLAEQAAGRLMEAAEKAGDRGTARATALHYVAEHPRGAYSGLARRLAADE